MGYLKDTNAGECDGFSLLVCFVASQGGGCRDKGLWRAPDTATKSGPSLFPATKRKLSYKGRRREQCCKRGSISRHFAPFCERLLSVFTGADGFFK